jgi:hypothetical protein
MARLISSALQAHCGHAAWHLFRRIVALVAEGW